MSSNSSKRNGKPFQFIYRRPDYLPKRCGGCRRKMDEYDECYCRDKYPSYGRKPRPQEPTAAQKQHSRRPTAAQKHYAKQKIKEAKLQNPNYDLWIYKSYSNRRRFFFISKGDIILSIFAKKLTTRYAVVLIEQDARSIIWEFIPKDEHMKNFSKIDNVVFHVSILDGRLICHETKKGFDAQIQPTNLLETANTSPAEITPESMAPTPPTNFIEQSQATIPFEYLTLFRLLLYVFIFYMVMVLLLFAVI